MKTVNAAPGARLKQLLLFLLEALERVGQEHEELYDAEVRDAMSAVVLAGFVDGETPTVPATFGVHDDPAADRAITDALLTYLREATPVARRSGLDRAGRLAAFQDGDVATRGERQHHDDFFGWHVDEPCGGS